MDPSTLRQLHQLRQMAEEIAAGVSRLRESDGSDDGLSLAHAYAHTLADQLAQVGGQSNAPTVFAVIDETLTFECGCSRSGIGTSYDANAETDTPRFEPLDSEYEWRLRPSARESRVSIRAAPIASESGERRADIALLGTVVDSRERGGRHIDCGTRARGTRLVR